jgi:hypothetical protein
MYDFKLQVDYILCNIRWKLGTPYYIEITLSNTLLHFELKLSDIFIELVQSSTAGPNMSLTKINLVVLYCMNYFKLFN